MKQAMRSETMSYIQTVTTVAVIIFALLMVAVERPMRIAGRDVLPISLGIVGLLFVAAAMTAIPDLRKRPSDGDEPGGTGGAMTPVIFEVGLWALAALYVVRLVEIARG